MHSSTMTPLPQVDVINQLFNMVAITATTCKQCGTGSDRSESLLDLALSIPRGTPNLGLLDMLKNYLSAEVCNFYSFLFARHECRPMCVQCRGQSPHSKRFHLLHKREPWQQQANRPFFGSFVH